MQTLLFLALLILIYIAIEKFNIAFYDHPKWIKLKDALRKTLIIVGTIPFAGLPFGTWLCNKMGIKGESTEISIITFFVSIIAQLAYMFVYIGLIVTLTRS